MKNAILTEAKAIHNGKYEYLEDNLTDKTIEYVCPTHGVMVQNVKRHLQGFGCVKCSYAKRSKPNKLTKTQFVEKAIELHRIKIRLFQIRICE